MQANYFINAPFVILLKVKTMANNRLTYSHSVRFTSDQNKALDILISIGFNRNKFVRLAVEEKLYRDYRKILKQIEKENNREYIPF